MRGVTVRALSHLRAQDARVVGGKDGLEGSIKGVGLVRVVVKLEEIGEITAFQMTVSLDSYHRVFLRVAHSPGFASSADDERAHYVS